MNTNKKSRTITKQIQFNQNNIEFIVEVTYTHDKELPRYWKAEVIAPAGIETIKVYQGTPAAAIMAKKVVQVLEQDNAKVDDDCEFNVYWCVVNKVTYLYFNRNEIAKYKRKIGEFNQKIDDKYQDDFERLLNNKREAKRSFKAGEITKNEYMSAKQNNEDFRDDILALKNTFENRYFEYGDLKEGYRNPDYRDYSVINTKIFIVQRDKETNQHLISKE